MIVLLGLSLIYSISPLAIVLFISLHYFGKNSIDVYGKNVFEKDLERASGV